MKKRKWKACIHARDETGNRGVNVDQYCPRKHERQGKRFTAKIGCETCPAFEPKSTVLCSDGNCQHNRDGTCQLKEIAFDMEGRCLSCCVSVTT